MVFLSGGSGTTTRVKTHYEMSFTLDVSVAKYLPFISI
jgi:hypothetical protein